jgi:hypothetical protein
MQMLFTDLQTQNMVTTIQKVQYIMKKASERSNTKITLSEVLKK